MPDLYCEQDGEKKTPFHFCDCPTCAQDGVRPGIVMKEEGIFHVSVRMNSVDVAVCLKFSYSAHVMLQSQGREFHNTGIQCLTQCSQMCIENDMGFVEKQPHNCMSHLCKFHCYWN
jgi:hypothetical protein